MEWNEEIDISRRKITSQLIVKRCIEKGWKIAGFKTNPAVFLVYPPGKDKPVQIFSSSPSGMGYPAAKIAEDKYVTSSILSYHNIPTPDEVLISSDSEDLATDFLIKNGVIVVKPLDGSHGNGVTVGISSKDELSKALENAKKYAHDPNNKVLIQKQLSGVDLRVVCIDYKFADSISRIPASVTGDGEHTIEELILTTNKSEDRGEEYRARLNIIPMDLARDFLGEAVNSIPAEGESVQVIGVSNVGKGGERLNVKDRVPDFLKRIAEEVSQILELPVCGVDFMIKRLPEATDTIEDIDPRVIEVNSCPSLAHYEDLQCQDQKDFLDSYLELIARY